jgi:hypothetical protein
MGTTYTGYQPRTFTLQPTGHGRFISALAPDDGDDDDAAHINPLPMADMDNVQFLAWRVPDLVSGDTLTYTAAVSLRNAFTFTGPCKVAGGSASWFFWAPCVVSAGATMYIGDPSGLSGVGHLVVERGSDITADGTTSLLGVARIRADGGNAAVEVINGAHLNVDAASDGTILGDLTIGSSTGSTSTTVRSPTTYSGDRAYRVPRVKAIPKVPPGGSPGDPVTINAEEADIWEIQTGISAAYVVVIAASSLNFTFTIRQRDPSVQGQDVTIEDHTFAGILGTFKAVNVGTQYSASAHYFNRGSVQLPFLDGKPWDGVCSTNTTPTIEI